ncbi:hypothetical protein WMY93_010662 [Mugilogobius chulae]|uniref:PCI domain-containing protein n=1 Tax=Mugilogobius chulae TaxID=88201 RepID=A0AAW0PEA9_9GOBI
MAAAAVVEFQRAQSLISTDRNASIDILHSIVRRDVQENDEEAVRVKEQSILELGTLLAKTGQAAELGGLLKFVRPFLISISKAKAARLVRSLLDLFLDMEAATGQEVELCLECIEWAKAEKRTFLRQLWRTTANAIYCPPKLQAALDMQSGIIHAAEEKDWKTAYSYFFEAFEGYDSIDSPRAITSLKYMLLCKLSSTQYKAELRDDPIINTHLAKLYDNLLEQNLIRVIEPFSRVQIEHISGLIKLSKGDVERKLSQMILDKKFHGILDQGEGVLIIFEEPPVDKTYEAALETIQNMSKVVDSLYNKAKKLT